MEALLVMVGLVMAGVFLFAPVVSLVMSWNARARITRLEENRDELQNQVIALRRELDALRRRPVQAPVVVAPVAAPPVETPVETPVVHQAQVEPVPETEAASAPAAAPAAAPVAESAPSESAPVAPVPVEPAAAPFAGASPPPRPPRPPPSPPAAPIPFERVAIWLLAGMGSLGVLTAGLVFYDLAVERGLITTSIRYALGLIAGTALIVGAEILWKRDYRVPAAGVQAAGVGVLYAALYAGYSRYDLVPNLPTFALMAGVTAIATVLAVRHGSLFLAVLGAVGGYATPIALSTGQNKAVALFTYIAFLNIGLLVAARRKSWPVLVGFAALCTVAVQVGWGFSFRAADQLFVALAAPLVLGGLFVVLALRAGENRALALTAAAASLTTLLAPLPYFAPTSGVEGAGGAAILAIWLPAVVLGLSLVGARLRAAPVVVAPYVIGALPLMIFAPTFADATNPALWPVVLAIVAVAVAAMVSSRVADHWAPNAVGLGTSWLAWLTAAMVLADRNASTLEPGLVATLSLSGISLWMSARGKLGLAPLVGLFGSAFWLGAMLRPELLDAGLGGQLLAVSALFYVAFAVFPFLVWKPGVDAPAPPWIAAALAGPLYFFPLYQGWEAAFGTSAIGLLPAMIAVVTVVEVAALVRVWQAKSDDGKLALFAAVALLFASGAIPVQLDNEWLTIGWALEVAALAWLRSRLRHPLILGTTAALAALVVARLLFNVDALHYHDADGALIFNWTLYTWGVPAAALLFASRRLRAEPEPLPGGLLVGGIALLFALINVEISHAFAGGGQMQISSRDFAEGMTRSLSWAAFGVALLVSGIVSGGRLLRFIAFGMLLLAAAKVGLVDMWSLGGFARVGSLLGLGLFLLVAAVLFRKLEMQLTSAKDAGGEGQE